MDIHNQNNTLNPLQNQLVISLRLLKLSKKGRCVQFQELTPFSFFPSPDIVLSPEPPPVIDPQTNKVLKAILKIASLGLELSVDNGEAKDGQGQGIGSEGLTRKLTTAFIFGNGFENEERAEDTHDPLMEKFIGNLEDPNDDSNKRDSLINPLRKFIVDLYEETKLVANAIDWLGDFGEDTGLPRELKFFIDFIKRGGAPLTEFFKARENLAEEPFYRLLPDIGKQKANKWFQSVKRWYLNRSGFGNDLVGEVTRKLEDLQRNGRGPLADSIAFAHSGFAAPLLTAIEQKKYDVQTVLVYEGPHPNYYDTFTNPHLKRIIHVQGTGTLFDGDSLVPFLGDAHFRNNANPNFENINIHIKGAFHSDFSYNEANWNDVRYAGKTAAQSQSYF